MAAPANPDDDKRFQRMISDLDGRMAVVRGSGGTTTVIATPSPQPKPLESEHKESQTRQRAKATIMASLATLSFVDQGTGGWEGTMTPATLDTNAEKIIERHSGTARVQALGEHLHGSYMNQAKNRDRLFYTVDRNPSMPALREAAEFFTKGRFERQAEKGQHEKSGGCLAFFHFISNDAKTAEMRDKQQLHEQQRERQGKPTALPSVADDTSPLLTISSSRAQREGSGQQSQPPVPLPDRYRPSQ